MQPLTLTDLHALPPVVDLMTAALGIGIGRRGYQVLTADLFTLLGIPPTLTSVNQQT